MSAALKIPRDVPNPPATVEGSTAKAVQDTFALASRLGLDITETSSELGNAAQSLDQQSGRLHSLLTFTQQIAQSNRSITATLAKSGSESARIRSDLATTVGMITVHVDAAQDDLKTLAVAAERIFEELDGAATELAQMQSSGAQIQNIAREIQLLAVNAGVEAARHGAAGRGFAVIAEAVKKLADQTRTATSQSQRHLVKISETITRLQSESDGNLAAARQANVAGTTIREEAHALGGIVRSAERMIADIEGIAPQVNTNSASCSQMIDHLSAVSRSIDTANTSIQSATRNVERAATVTQDVSAGLLCAGVETSVSSLSRHCQEAAQQIAQLFEEAIESGRINAADLFDEAYEPIESTRPNQFRTRFLALTDLLLPAVQEPLLGSDPRIIFCAAVDRNGYLPTHNRIFSKPQGADEVWNAHHCRNRRMFQDRASMRSARNRKPLLLQTYRRDMGGGDFVVMQEVCAPIMVRGRHWGGLRIGFKP
jgi:methyl-accepting chemotaxis protein